MTATWISLQILCCNWILIFHLTVCLHTSYEFKRQKENKVKHPNPIKM
jgi:hypothetical protein